MDFLLDVQLELSSVLADVTLRSQSSSTCSSSSVAMTPVLINIEQMLDDIRAATRLIVSKALEKRTTAYRATPMEIEDFRIKLESEDLVDYESETETENEEENGQEEKEHGYEYVGMKRHREDEEKDEQVTKRQETMLDNGDGFHLENRLRQNVENYTVAARMCRVLNEHSEVKEVQKSITYLAGCTTKSMRDMINLLKTGDIPSLETAMSFRDATVLLPRIIQRNQEKRKMSKKWIASTTKYIGQILAFVKKKPELPKCLADPRLAYTQAAISGTEQSSHPDLLSKMEELISKTGVLEPEIVEGPVGKLASLYRTYFMSLKSSSAPLRTEEDWARFTTIGNILADWIHLAQQATSPPKLRVPLLRFERQVKGFTRANPGRIPDSLLQASSIVRALVQQSASGQKKRRGIL